MAAFHVRGREGEKGFWTRIGAAWPHQDGQGMTLRLDAIPADGRIVIRRARADAQQGGAA